MHPNCPHKPSPPLPPPTPDRTFNELRHRTPPISILAVFTNKNLNSSSNGNPPVPPHLPHPPHSPSPQPTLYPGLPPDNECVPLQPTPIQLHPKTRAGNSKVKTHGSPQCTPVNKYISSWISDPGRPHHERRPARFHPPATRKRISSNTSQQNHRAAHSPLSIRP